MSRSRACSVLIVVACGLALCATTTASAASAEPLFVFKASENAKPGNEFSNPCGLAVDGAGGFYVADYYHHAVDAYNSSHAYLTQLANEDPIDGPCGLSVDSNGDLYVNNFHRNVVRFTPSAFPPNSVTFYTGATTIDTEHSTGVAVGGVADNVYVDDRTYIAVYNSSGSPILDGEGHALRIGLGTLGSGYGLAFSGGFVYVADASSNNVKVYSSGGGSPILTVTGPPGGFASLIDAAVAVDSISGDIYVADSVGSPYTEHPETTVDVFSSTGAYKGHLKFNVINGDPVGLAVDNSAGLTQGRVYVTSGNSTGGTVYAYGPGSAIVSATQPAAFSLAVSISGTGSGHVASRAALECAEACQGEQLAGEKVELSALADPGSSFVGWSGAGCGEGAGDCIVTMNEAVSVSARFEAEPTPTPNAGPMSVVLSTDHPAFQSYHRKHGHRRTRHRRHRSRHRGNQ